MNAAPAPSACALRLAEPGDEPALADICVRTGHHGGDASGVYPDASALAQIYLLPYLHLEPAWCWVAEDAAGVAGYLVATPDTLTLARRAESQWWPALKRRHPLPDPDDERPQAQLTRRLHAGVLTDLPFLDDYPAHLHIDLLPRARRQGIGRRLMDTLLQALADHGVPGVHLGVSNLNPGAIAFYERLGFVVLERASWGLWMGRRPGALKEQWSR